MSDSELYETETMAELCASQGRLGEAIEIYKRLAATPPASVPVSARGRWKTRLVELESRWQPGRIAESAPVEIPLPVAPGVTVLASEDQVTVAWALSSQTPAPALELLLIQRTQAGIETTKKAIALKTNSGRLGFSVTGIHSAMAAVGSTVGGAFVPVARSPRK